MITYSVSEKSIIQQDVDCTIILVPEGSVTAPTGALRTLLSREASVTTLLDAQKFTGKRAQVVTVPFVHDTTARYYIFVGLGAKPSRSHEAVERYRRALAQGLNQVKKYDAATCAFTLPATTWCGVSKEILAEQAAVITSMVHYAFDSFISDKADKPRKDIAITVCTDTASKKDVTKALKRGESIGASVNKARYWIDMPPSLLTPPELATQAQEIADEHNLAITIFSEKEIIKMGMGGLAAVSRGSSLDCKFVVMRYTAPQKTAPTVALVGKGITFDSGGLSLKPAQYMENMKEDMGGAAAILAAMNAIGVIKPRINVVGVMPLAENLPGESAVKPGDIIRFYNGKTAEVRNTDAEGRLILADALAYAAQEIKPDAMIDLATLTGACQHALGPFFSGLMGKHDDLLKKIQHAADRTGDRVWQLPFDDDYKAAISSKVADIRNTGKSGYHAGSITAGFFLHNFVGDTPWAHLDIAGTVFDVPDIPYFGSGATGAGVRLLIDLVCNWR